MIEIIAEGEPIGMQSRILLFDIDGTLLSTGGAGQIAMEQALAAEFDVPMPMDNIPTAGRTDRGIENDVFSRYGIEISDANRQRFMEGYLQRLPDCLSQLDGGLLPGVPQLLQSLSQRSDVYLSLLTGNYQRGAWTKLKYFGIDGFFTEGAFGDLHADRDDLARVAMDLMSERMQRVVAGSEIIVIGDTPADIRCARAIGATVVAVATGIYSAEQLQERQPDLLLTDFRDTERVVSGLLNV